MSKTFLEKCCDCPDNSVCLCLLKPVVYYSQQEVDELLRVEHGSKLLAQTDLVVLKHGLRRLQSDLKASIEDEDENVHIVIDNVFNKFFGVDIMSKTTEDICNDNVQLGSIPIKSCSKNDLWYSKLDLEQLHKDLDSAFIMEMGDIHNVYDNSKIKELIDTIFSKFLSNPLDTKVERISICDSLLSFNDWLDWINCIERDICSNEHFSKEYRVACYNVLLMLKADLRYKYSQSSGEVSQGSHSCDGEIPSKSQDSCSDKSVSDKNSSSEQDKSIVKVVSRIYFELDNSTSVRIMRDGLQIGQLWSEKDGVTPFPHDKTNKTINSVQLCGFDGQSEVWACYPFGGHKDSCFYFDVVDVDSLERYRLYVENCIRNNCVDSIKNFHDWRLHNY